MSQVEAILYKVECYSAGSVFPGMRSSSESQSITEVFVPSRSIAFNLQTEKGINLFRCTEKRTSKPMRLQMLGQRNAKKEKKAKQEKETKIFLSQQLVDEMCSILDAQDRKIDLRDQIEQLIPEMKQTVEEEEEGGGQVKGRDVSQTEEDRNRDAWEEDEKELEEDKQSFGYFISKSKKTDK